MADDARRKEIVALGKDPIRADALVGDPVRYETEFEELQAQMDRIGSITGEEVDWRTVVELGIKILKEKSKDLLVMTYLTVGLFEREGYAGLAAGLEAYKEFVNTFWDRCFPKVKPPQGRMNAVEYVVDRIVTLAELKGGKAKKHPGASDVEAVHACAELSEELVKIIDEKFADEPPEKSPNTPPLRRALKALKDKVGPIGGVPEPAAASAAPGAAPAAGAAAPAGGAAVAVPDQFASATQAIDIVKKVAKYLTGQDDKDARGYRLSRLAMFSSLAEPKDRIIPPIPAPLRAKFENLATSGDFPNLLSQAEAQFLITPLWLDMQRYVATGLNGMGPMYENAKKAVMFETIALQSRLPALFDLTFKDGTPFADGATKAWLDDARGEIGGGGGGGGGGGDKLSTAIGEARKLLTESKHSEAIKRLADEAANSGGRRDQFRAQLALARFCIDMNKPVIAASLLEGLDGVIERYHLEDWEPTLAGEALQYLIEALAKTKAKPTPADMEHRSAVFGRLCRLDPTAALKLDGTVTAVARPAAAR